MSKTTKSWNPFFGCGFYCVYCFLPKLGEWIFRMHPICLKCQNCEPHIHPERLGRIPHDKVIFVCEDGDIAFCEDGFVRMILERMREDKREGRIWLLQSKNPIVFTKYLEYLPENTFLLTTLETNRDTTYSIISKAPKPSKRFLDFRDLRWKNKFVAVEPIMDFDLDQFVFWLVQIKPECVFIGFNTNKKVELPEPSIHKVFELIRELKENHIQVMTKDFRGHAEKHAYKDWFE